MTLLNGIFLRALTDPQKPAIFLSDRIITYGMIRSGMLSAESKIKQLGLTEGEWASIDVNNPARHLILLLALWRLGIPSASIRPDLSGAALHAGCKLFFTDTPATLPENARQLIVTDDWFTERTSGLFAYPKTQFEADDVCRITFTSGTTGVPKPVAHTEAAYERRVFDTLINSFQRPWTRLMILGGLSPGFGPARALQALWLGLTVCFPATPDDSIRMVNQFCIETLMASPLHLMDLLERHGRARTPLPSLTSIQFGGASMGLAGLEALKERFGAALMEEYASTEASIAGVAPDALLAMRKSGPPVFAPVQKVKVVRDGTPVPVGEVGEIRINSPSMATAFDGNLKCPPNDGWFYPGDLGFLRSDGLFAVLGRKGNVINAGGVKLNAEAVEEILLRHPLVKEAAVLGATSQTITQIRAVVITSASCTAEDIIAWVRKASPETMLSGVQFTDAIPKTGTGKIARDALAKRWGATST